MAYLLGKDVRVFISTEDPTYGISQSGSTMSAESWSATSLLSDFIIPPLKTNAAWAGTEADVTGSQPARAREITSIDGCDPLLDKQREDIDFLGRTLTDHIAIRTDGEVTVTKKMDSNEWSILYALADMGVTGSGLNPATQQTVTNSGFRVFIRLSSGTGSGHTWISYRNATFAGHKVTPGSAKVTVEQLKFESNLYNVKLVPETKSTTLAEL